MEKSPEYGNSFEPRREPHRGVTHRRGKSEGEKQRDVQTIKGATGVYQTVLSSYTTAKLVNMYKGSTLRQNDNKKG